jgi:DNA-binding response OmpR family regulator
VGLSVAGTVARVLAIEDEADIRTLLRAVLEPEGYDITEAATGRDGLREFHRIQPDLVILDVGLPDLDGWEVLERIRDLSDAALVLVLTGRASEQDKVRGLTGGADDYLTKPFSQVELLARMQALRRRRPANGGRVFDDGELRLDFGRRQLTVGGQEVPLTPTEFRLLGALVDHAGQVLSTDQLIDLAWDGTGSDAPVKYAVLRLRRKLGWEPDGDDCPLETVRGFGYRYRPRRL